MTSINCALMASKIPIMVSISFSRRAQGQMVAAAGCYTFKRAEGFENSNTDALRDRILHKKVRDGSVEAQRWKSWPEPLLRFDLKPPTFHLLRLSPLPERVETEHSQAA